jgi:hypothetical protein
LHKKKKQIPIAASMHIQYHDLMQTGRVTCGHSSQRWELFTLKLGVLLENEGLYNLLRGKAVDYMYNYYERFHHFTTFCVVLNVWLHINTRGYYNMLMGKSEMLGVNSK